MKERETFASRLGFVLISAGCAIGLGNVWRFPYIVGQYGGAAFVLIYLLFLVIMGLPIMAMEFSVGRASRKSILASFQVLEPKGSKWHWYGWFGMAGNYLLMMFYTTIAGWLLLYFFKVAAGEFRGLDAAGVETAFGAMQGNVGIQLLFMGIVVVLGMLICSRGLKNGVEKVNKAMMLCLLALLVVLAVRALTLPGAMEGVKFYLVPNFHNLMYDADGNFRLFRAIYDAMGQAFFSLSINGAGMLIYGSYMKKGENILRHAGMTAVLDTLAALLAGFAILPAVFAFGIDPTSGPQLMFVTLPQIFQQMPGGRIFALLFFVSVFFAGITSLMNMLEACGEALTSTFRLSRTVSTLLVGAAAFLPGLFLESLAGMGGWMDLITIYVSPFGALLVAVCIYFVLGMKDIRAELALGRARAPGRLFGITARFYVFLTVAVWILGIAYGGIG